MIPCCKKCKCHKTVKAGFIHGKQRYKCKACGSYFLPGTVKYHSSFEKMDAVKLYLDGMSIRGIGRFLKVSHVTIMNWLKTMAEKLRPPLPLYAKYIEIDELYFFLKRKQKKNRKYVLLAICRDTKRLLGFQVGGRGIVSIEKLFYKISPVKCEVYCTDKHKPFKKVFAGKNHITSIGSTNTIEGINTSIRRYLSRFHRKTVCYTKSLNMLEISMALLMYKFDTRYNEISGVKIK